MTAHAKGRAKTARPAPLRATKKPDASSLSRPPERASRLEEDEAARFRDENGEPWTSLTYLQALYSDARLDRRVRIDAAKAALPYEYAREAAKSGAVDDEPKPYNVNIIRFSDIEKEEGLESDGTEQALLKSSEFR